MLRNSDRKRNLRTDTSFIQITPLSKEMDKKSDSNNSIIVLDYSNSDRETKVSLTEQNENTQKKVRKPRAKRVAPNSTPVEAHENDEQPQPRNRRPIRTENLRASERILANIGNSLPDYETESKKTRTRQAKKDPPFSSYTQKRKLKKLSENQSEQSCHEKTPVKKLKFDDSTQSELRCTKTTSIHNNTIKFETQIVKESPLKIKDRKNSLNLLIDAIDYVEYTVNNDTKSETSSKTVQLESKVKSSLNEVIDKLEDKNGVHNNLDDQKNEIGNLFDLSFFDKDILPLILTDVIIFYHFLINNND
jgi:hypothetical protein